MKTRLVNDQHEDHDKNMLDESLRRLGGILASPSLVTSYAHTTPQLERMWLQRQGLTKQEAHDFLSLMCQHGLLDEGAKAVVYQVCRQERIDPGEAARMLLQGKGWPAEEEGL